LIQAAGDIGCVAGGAKSGETGYEVALRLVSFVHTPKGYPVNLRRATVNATATYAVVGMTCGHCVNAVSAEITKLPGVTEVAVDLDTGAVKVSSEHPLDESAVEAAIAEAGYAMAT